MSKKKEVWEILDRWWCHHYHRDPPCGGDSSESTHFILDGFPLRGRPNHQAEKANKKLNKWVWGSEKNPSCKFGIYWLKYWQWIKPYRERRGVKGLRPWNMSFEVIQQVIKSRKLGENRRAEHRLSLKSSTGFKEEEWILQKDQVKRGRRVSFALVIAGVIDSQSRGSFRREREPRRE